MGGEVRGEYVMQEAGILKRKSKGTKINQVGACAFRACREQAITRAVPVCLPACLPIKYGAARIWGSHVSNL